MNLLTIDDLLELAESAKVLDNRHEYLLSLPWAKEGIYYNFLYLLAQQMQPNVIVELGVHHGTGTAHFVWGAPLAKYHGVDIDLSSKLASFTVPDEQPEGHLMFFRMTSLEFAENRKAVNAHQPNHYPPIDILFIDTDHTTEQCLAEYHAFLPLMTKGGVILFDDIFMDGMKGVWPAIAEPKVILPDLHANLGFGAAIIQ